MSKVIDWEAIECEVAVVMASGATHGLESDITRMFKELVMCGHYDDRIPLTQHDSIVYEMALKFGRSDIVVFHVDGSASVIEVKNGANGYNHVVAGIGQAGLYAAQLGMKNGALTKVRKCLLWTSTGILALDALIEQVCEQAAVIPMPYASMATHMAVKEAVKRVMSTETM